MLRSRKSYGFTTFNSSLKDTSLERSVSRLLCFCFQFLIKGYLEEEEESYPPARTFNSSLKDTNSPPRYGGRVESFQFLIKGYYVFFSSTLDATSTLSIPH